MKKFRLRAIWAYLKLEGESPWKERNCRCCREHRTRRQWVCQMLGSERNLRAALPPYFIVEETGSREVLWVRSWFGIQTLSLSSLETALSHQFLVFEVEIKAACFRVVKLYFHHHHHYFCYYYLTHKDLPCLSLFSCFTHINLLNNTVT